MRITVDIGSYHVSAMLTDAFDEHRWSIIEYVNYGMHSERIVNRSWATTADVFKMLSICVDEQEVSQ